MLFWNPFEKWMAYYCNHKEANRNASRVVEGRRILMVFIIWHLMLMILFRLASHFHTFDKLYSSSLNAASHLLAFFSVVKHCWQASRPFVMQTHIKHTICQNIVLFYTKEIIRRIVWICDGDKRILQKQFESKLVFFAHYNWNLENLVSIHIFVKTHKCFVLYEYWVQLTGCEWQY